MKWNNLFLIVFVILLMGSGSDVAADLTPEQTGQAKVLIAQFTAKEFAKRRKAGEELVKMGPDILPLVRKALAETKDNEVKLRCGMVWPAVVAHTLLDLCIAPGLIEKALTGGFSS